MNDDCVAMVIYGHFDRLALCRRPGGDDDSNCWIPLDGPLRQYTQIVYHSQTKLFFALTHSRELEAWDLYTDPINGENLGLSNGWLISFRDDDDTERKTSYCGDPDYLVYYHQSHELFIVTRYTAAAIDQDGTLVLSYDNLKDEFPYQTLIFWCFKARFHKPWSRGASILGWYPWQSCILPWLQYRFCSFNHQFP